MRVDRDDTPNTARVAVPTDAGADGKPDGRTLRLSSEDFLDLCQQLLAAGGAVRFAVEGGSMRPSIKPGDVALGDPLGERPAQPGEVVLLRGSASRPVVHRVVARRRRQGEWLLTTTGDAAGGLDHVVRGSDVLARVVATVRDGNRIPVGRRLPGLGKRLRAWWRLLLHDRAGPRHPLRTVPSWVAGVMRRLRDAVRAATRLPPDEATRAERAAIVDELRADVRSVWRWRQGTTHIVRLRRGWRCLGVAHVSRAYPRELGVENWWITNLYTQRSWRGLGVGRKVVEGCIEVARRHGVAELSAAVNEGNGASLSLFASAGFRRSDDPDLEKAVGRVHKRPLLRAPRLVVFSRRTSA